MQGTDDLERQQDELTVMSEIFTSEEFSYHSNEAGVFTVFDAHIFLPRNFLLSLSKDTAKTEFPICHLPPIRLVTFLVKGYPSHHPPDFTLSCSWLSKQKLDLLVAELQKLWDENHSEILFIWFSFLKDQSVELLSLQSHYDLSEKFLVGSGKLNQEQDLCRKDVKSHEHSSNSRNDASSSRIGNNNNKYRYDYRRRRLSALNKKKSEEIAAQDINRKDNGELDYLRSKAVDKAVKESIDKLKTYQKQEINQLYYSLIEYNALKSQEEFNKNLQDCNVCFSQVLGEQCKQLACSHITCIECLKRMCEVHIKHGTVEEIVCSQENCNFEIPVNVIQELVTKELFERFDKLMLNRTLDKISNMNYCPLPHCQYPVSTQTEEALAVCPSCNHAFCVYCKRAYHGVEGCRLKSDEKRELIELYRNGDYNKQLELEKRYGKKQLYELVNAAKTEDWMSKHSKRCPCCHINIEKNDGCNKMICRKCNTHFCWLCLGRVSSLNPYLHFQDPKSRCFDLLFEGIFDEFLVDNDEELEDDDDFFE